MMDDDRRQLLSAFLIERRSRIGPAIPSPGEHPRRVETLATIVTPREIADAAGINRRWYELAERGEPIRASATVLRALSDVLGLNAQERAVLVQLATPYLDRVAPRDESLELRDAFGSLREYLRKLNACSTTDEVLTLAQDAAASYFPEASYLTTAARLPDGRWAFRGEATGTASRVRAFAHNVEEIVAPLLASDSQAGDELMCFPDAALPGDLLKFDDYDEARVARLFGSAYDDFKRVHEPMLAGVIRTRANLVAHLYIGDFRNFYETSTDYALVSAIADFASLATVP